MKNKFIKLKSIELCDRVFDGTHDSPKYVNNGYPLVTSKFISNLFDLKEVPKISEIDFNEINKRSKIAENDVLISLIGTVGLVNIVRISSPSFAIKNIGVLRCKNKLDSYYLYYFMQSRYAQNEISKMLAGSTQKFLSLDNLRNFYVLYPENSQNERHIVNTIGSIDDLIDNYTKQKESIINILKLKIESYIWDTPISFYNPDIIKSGINKFTNLKEYVDTSSIDGVNNILKSQTISLEERPSRANMQPVENSIWFAKMKDSYKIIVLTDDDKDIINNCILSTGFLGIKSNDNLPLSFIASVIISNKFTKERDINSVGTTMISINNENLKNIKIPKLNKKELKEFDKNNKCYINMLSLIRKKIILLNRIKNLLLDKYF